MEQRGTHSPVFITRSYLIFLVAGGANDSRMESVRVRFHTCAAGMRIDGLFFYAKHCSKCFQNLTVFASANFRPMASLRLLYEVFAYLVYQPYLNEGGRWGGSCK